MTWRWHICFSLLLILCLPVRSSAGDVTGEVQLIDSKDSAVRKHSDYSNVVVWLEPAVEKPIPVVNQHARMVQKNKEFSPHVLPIALGTTVDFPNLDPIFHSAFSNFSGQIFDMALYPPGSSRSFHFTRPGVVRVFCNIHPTMSALIIVLNSREFAVTDRTGRFIIRNVPPGLYKLHVFHERAAPQTLEKLTNLVAVDQAGLAIPPMKISEAGYIAVPHKNKYGKDYPSSEDSPYSPLPMQ